MLYSIFFGKMCGYDHYENSRVPQVTSISKLVINPRSKVARLRWNPSESVICVLFSFASSRVPHAFTQPIGSFTL